MTKQRVQWKGLQSGNVGDLFRITVGVRQGCPLVPMLFDIFLEKITEKTLHGLDTVLSTGGRHAVQHAVRG